MTPELRNLLSLCTREERDRVLAVDEIITAYGGRIKNLRVENGYHFPGPVYTRIAILYWSFSSGIYIWYMGDCKEGPLCAQAMGAARAVTVPVYMYARDSSPVEVERVCRYARGDKP